MFLKVHQNLGAIFQTEISTALRLKNLSLDKVEIKFFQQIKIIFKSSKNMV